ncbi:MAG: ABC transporter ATP-binding protein [Filifactor alocis]|nr:ABC transporter ATP-binding protein [Filifactor alocis]
MMILTGTNIRKTYRNADVETQVLKGVDIELKAGEFVCIMGRSGSGKSTLLNALSTLDRFDDGEVRFEGREISKLSDNEAAKLRRGSFGFVFQLPKMVRNLNILDNILLPSTLYAKDRQAAVSKARDLMRRVGIEDLADKKSSQASGGQLQRAGLCRALINDPKLIFADEPTGALDSKTGREVLELFSSLRSEGRTLLLVTHDINVAARADRVVFMKDGLLHKEVRLGTDEEDNLSLIQDTLHQL